MRLSISNLWLRVMARNWKPRRPAPDRATRPGRRLGVESLEARAVPAVTLSGLNTAAGQVTFTGDGSADAVVLARVEVVPGSGNYVLMHNVSGGGLASFIDLDPVAPGDQTLTVAGGGQTARNITVSLNGGNDALALDGSWGFNHAVTFDGGAGTDKLSGNNTNTAWQVTNVTSGSGTAGSGTENVSFAGVETLAGGTGTDTLTGEAAARVWNLGATQTYTDGNSTVTFSRMDVLQGGSEADTFNVRANASATLRGGAGDDVVAFHLAGGVGGDPVVLTGSVDGQSGADALTYANYEAGDVVLVTLTGVGGTDGFAGTELSLTGTFTNVDEVVGTGGATSSLVGLDAGGAFAVQSGDDQYVSTNTLTFAGMANLVGGSGSDTFTVSVDHTGNLDGNTGGDVLNFNGGVLTGDAIGDAGADDFNFAGGTVTGSVTGDAGADTFDVTATTTVSSGLVGGDDGDTFNVSAALTGAIDAGDGADAVNVSGTGSVSGNVTAGLGNDTVTLSGSSSVGGAVAGGSGTDTLSFAGYGTARSVALSAAGASDGFNGSEASIAGGFTDVDALTGGSGTDALAGLNADATWEVDGSNRYVSGSNVLTFSAVENLAGGSGVDTFEVTADHTGTLTGSGGADTFAFSSDGDLTGSVAAGDGADAVTVGGTASVSGSADLGDGADTLNLAGSGSVGAVAGGSGADTLTYAGYGSSASIAISAAGATDGFDGTGTGITGTFTNVDSLIGSSNTDTLTGLDAAATWEVDGSNAYTSGGRSIGFSAVENLTGGSGVDTFSVSTAHAGVLTGNGGADAFSLSGSAALTGSIAGNAGDDSITLAGTSSVSGTVAGGSGADTFSFDGSTSGRSITLTAQGQTDGFDGTEAAVGGFTDVDALTGGSNTDALTGLNADATWALGVTKTYTSGGRSLTFTAVENLTGGSAADTFGATDDHTGNLAGADGADAFTFTADADLTGDLSGGNGADSVSLANTSSVSGTVDTGAGNDSITLANSATVGGRVSGGVGIDGLSYAGYGTSVGVTLTGPAAGDGYQGFATALAGGFDTVDSVTGSGNADTFRGGHANSSWTFDATITYSDGAANTLAVGGFESLVGGAGDDAFSVKNNTTLSGVTVDGGVGSNSLSFADATNTAGVSVNITGEDAGSVAGSFGFIGVGTLTGTSKDDTFTFTADAGALSGTITGGGGTNAVSYAGYTAAVRVNLAAGAASGTAGVTGIQNVIGGSGSDILIGGNADNVLSGGGGHDVLVGGGGADALTGDVGNDILIGGLGADTLTGGDGDDILIGGVTTYDANIKALTALMAEWSRTGVPYATRVGRIFGTATGGLNGAYRLNDATVNNDAGAVDTLTGSAGLDWFLTTADTVTDANTGGTENQTSVS